jgi:hypothetical protein
MDGSQNPRFMGWEYSIPFGCVRKFDGGKKVWFLYAKRHQYIMYYNPSTEVRVKTGS